MVNSETIDEKILENRNDVMTTMKFPDGLQPSLKRFSKFNRLILTQVYVLRFWQRIWYQSALTHEEIMARKRYIIVSVQMEEDKPKIITS